MTDERTRAAMQVDHVGVDLWRAFRAYEERMFAGLRAAGYDVTTADSDVLAFVGPDGTRAVDLARSRRITKQAAQEQVARLVRRGYLDVGPDPNDRRAKRVTLTPRGEALMRDFEGIKRALHAEVEEALGPDGLDALRETLGAVRARLAAEPSR